MKLHNVTMIVEIIIAEDEIRHDVVEGRITSIDASRELDKAVKSNRWVHVSNARIVHTREDK